MLKTNDILYKVTQILSNAFDEDVFIDEEEQAFERACFFVQVNSSNSRVSTKSTNKKDVLITVDYLQQYNKSIVRLNEVADKLDTLFNRKINVKDRFINVDSTEINLLEDEIGYRLNYLINVSFDDDIEVSENETDDIELMQDINLNLKN